MPVDLERQPRRERRRRVGESGEPAESGRSAVGGRAGVFPQSSAARASGRLAPAPRRLFGEPRLGLRNAPASSSFTSAASRGVGVLARPNASARRPRFGARARRRLLHPFLGLGPRRRRRLQLRPTSPKLKDARLVSSSAMRPSRPPPRSAAPSLFYRAGRASLRARAVARAPLALWRGLFRVLGPLPRTRGPPSPSRRHWVLLVFP